MSVCPNLVARVGGEVAPMTLPACPHRVYHTGWVKPQTTPQSPCCKGSKLVRNALGAYCRACNRKYHLVLPTDKSSARRQYSE